MAVLDIYFDNKNEVTTATKCIINLTVDRSDISMHDNFDTIVLRMVEKLDAMEKKLENA